MKIHPHRFSTITYIGTVAVLAAFHLPLLPDRFCYFDHTTFIQMNDNPRLSTRV